MAKQVIQIQVKFDRAVTVTPGAMNQLPFLLLDSGTNVKAVYASGSGTDTLVFTYTPAAGQRSYSLDYASAEALRLNGSVIRDLVNNRDANLKLPTPGLAGSLRANDLFFINLPSA
jgi:hypothetical protein